MKRRICRTLTWGLLVGGLPWIGGCSQESAGPSEDSGPVIQPVLAVASPDNLNPAVDAEPASTDAAPDNAKSTLPEAAPVTEKPAPPDVKLSPPLTEVAKLAQAGLSDNVVMAYITNSSSTFNLGSDQIIYLNDLGISGEIITAMIQHDQELSQAGVRAVTASTAPSPEPAQTTTPPLPEPATPPEGTASPTSIPDQETASSEPPQTEAGSSYFYDSLAPYGNWINVEGYGACWQPTVTVIHAGWQPYGDHGRWLYTDCGWYWQSDYSWGWAPFHYGRWFRHHHLGWCWWPDNVWAPSWVTWRYHGDFCGWAPLPPYACYQPGLGFSYYGQSVGVGFNFGLSADCYTFVPFGHFCDYRPYSYYLPRNHVTQIFNQTTIINNNVRINGNNNTVIMNNGLLTDRVRAANKDGIRQAVVRESPTIPARSRPTERVRHEGRSLVLYRPHLPGGVPTAATEIRRSPRIDWPRGVGSAGGVVPAGTVAPKSVPGVGRQIRPSAEKDHRALESPAAASRQESSLTRRSRQPIPRGTSISIGSHAVAERPGQSPVTGTAMLPQEDSSRAAIVPKSSRQGIPRGTSISIGSRPVAKPAGQVPVTAAAAPQEDRTGRSFRVEPGNSIAPTPDPPQPRNLPPAPRSSPAIQQLQTTVPPAPGQAATIVSRPVQQVQVDRQPERYFNQAAPIPTPALPQVSPPPAAARQPSYSVPVARAAPSQPSFQARAPATYAAPPAAPPAPSRPTAPAPSAARGTQAVRDR